MNILFVHNNFPGQFARLAQVLVDRKHNVHAIGGPSARGISVCPTHKYRQGRHPSKDLYPFADRFEQDCLRGVAAAMVGSELSKHGFRPDVIIGHPGWGEMMFLSDVWPKAKVVTYAEYLNSPLHTYVGFDPEFGQRHLLGDVHLRAKNAGLLTTLTSSDLLISPTEWQRSLHPEVLRSRIRVVHDGIDTERVKPANGARLRTPSGTVLKGGDEVVTYVNRHLEPLRGMHILLRALPKLLAARSDCHVLIIGSDQGVPYGNAPKDGRTWKQILMSATDDRIDWSRVHWMGWVNYDAYLAALHLSRAHVYLTYPFVLSLSLLEALSAGCTVIASHVDPVREVIEDGKQGMLVDFFDVNGLVDKIIKVLTSKRNSFAQMQDAGRQTVVESYSRRVCMPRWISLIED